MESDDSSEKREIDVAQKYDQMSVEDTKVSSHRKLTIIPETSQLSNIPEETKDSYNLVPTKQQIRPRNQFSQTATFSLKAENK